MKKINNILIAIVAVAAASSLLCFIDENTVMQMVFLAIELCAAGALLGRLSMTKKSAPVTDAKPDSEDGKEVIKVQSENANSESLTNTSPYAKLVKEHHKIYNKIARLDYMLKSEHDYYYYNNSEQVAIVTKDYSKVTPELRILSLNGDPIQLLSTFKSKDLLPELSADIIENKLMSKLELLKKKLAMLAEEISEFTLTDVELPEENSAEPMVEAADRNEIAEAIRKTPFDEVRVVAINLVKQPQSTSATADTYTD